MMDSSELMIRLRAYLYDKMGVATAQMSYDYDMAMSDWRPLPEIRDSAVVQLEGVTGHVKPGACDIEALGIGL